MHKLLKFPGCIITFLLLSGLQSSGAQAQETVENQTLQQQLEATNRGFAERMDPAVVKNIEDAVAEVSESGIMATAKKAGDRAPDFTLPDATGKEVRLSSLLKDGPVVLTWYRGNW